MDNVWIAVITALVAPSLLAVFQQYFRRQEKQQDWDRQDKVAEQAAQAAQLLLERQTISARKVDEAASLLKENNKAVAVTAAETQGQLRQIHTLVNSNMTAAMQSEMDQREIALALMNEVIDLKKSSGIQPSTETKATLEQMAASIDELNAKLSDRLNQQTIATAEAIKTSDKIIQIKRGEP